MPQSLSAEEIAELLKADSRATKHQLDLHRFDKSGGAIGWQLQFDPPKKPGEVLADGSDLFNPRCKFDYELMHQLWNKRSALLAMASRLVELESALDHLERLDSSQGQRFWEPAEIFRQAKRLGWTGPTSQAKGG